MINLPGYLQRNGYKVPQDVKTGPFADAWGGRHTWALYEDEPERGKVFNSCMTRWKQTNRPWTDTYPAKSKICENVDQSKDAVLLVDIGGGRGHVSEDFVKDPAHRTGRVIVQDLPAALGDADSLSKQGIETMAYDFFTPQPIKGNVSLLVQNQAILTVRLQELKRTSSVIFCMTGRIVRVLKS